MAERQSAGVVADASAHPTSAAASSSKNVPSHFRAPWLVFWVGFAVRVLYMTLARTYHIRAYDDHFGFGWEMGRIARALVTGYGYADPFRGHTGPTAWTGPLYPLLLAGIFKLFGIYSVGAAWVAIAINCFFSALAARPTWEIAARCFNLRVAKWAAWLWALYPAAMQYAVRWVWEMNLTVLLFTTMVLVALRLRNVGEASGPASRPSWGLWASFGILWGAIALSNPSIVIFLPVCGVWLLLESTPSAGPDLTQRLGGATLAGLLFFGCIAPWIVRNWYAFHQFVPLRGNFGAELYLGNGPGATGLLMEYNHPEQAPDQLRLYGQMGELKYAKMRGDLAKAIIRANPALFMRNSLRRVFFFWFGVPHPADDAWYVEIGRQFNFNLISVAGLLGLALALKQRVPGSVLFLWIFLLLPLVYYVVTVHARFRHPFEPILAILGVYLFQSAEPRRAQDKTTGRQE
jgi:hypothetical protein